MCKYYTLTFRENRSFTDIRHISGLAYIALKIFRPDAMSTLTTERIVNRKELCDRPFPT